jgi:diguanylate cyclase (GGDEF)-like protein
MYLHYKNDPNDSKSISNNNITSIIEDQENNIWIGTKNGLNKYIKENESFLKVFSGEQSSELTSNNITSLSTNSNYEIYVGTNSGLNIFNYKANNIIKYPFRGYGLSSISSNNIKRLFVDNSQKLWISTDAGLNVFDPIKNEFSKYRQESSNPQSISSDQVNAIAQTDDGTIWAGTSNGVLEKLDFSTGKFTHYTSKEGIVCDSIYGLLAYKKDLWLSTNRGLFKFDSANNSVTHYTRENGLQKNEFNDGAFFISKQGEMFFGGENGFNNFHPNKITVQQIMAPTVITSLKAGGVEIPLSTEISVSYKQNTVSIEFANLDFTDPENINYKYMLVGLDTEWINNGNRNIATYNNLPPNNYIFKVATYSSDGKVHESELSINIKVTPNPFKTWWAFAIYFLIIFSGFFAYVKINMSNKEKEIKRQQSMIAMLKKVDKMKDELLANTSHEFRTPLNGIIGIADSIKDGIFGEVSIKAQNNLNLILSSAKRLLRLVNDILDLAKINKGELNISLGIVNFRNILDDSIDMLNLLAEKKGLKLINTITAEEILVLGDSFRIQQIIFNLVGNAIKFTDSGFVEIGAMKEKYDYIFYVKDSGIGIPKERLNDIFKDFVQVDGSTTRESQGTGLGLAITKKLIQIMGGDISVESTVGKGSNFIFHLPLANITSEEVLNISTKTSENFKDYMSEEIDIKDVILSQEEQTINDSENHLTIDMTTKILIVDDEMINRVDLNNRLLAAGNFTILNAENGEEAVTLITKEPDIDLVLMDVMMPKMSGLDACKAIRKKFDHFEIPILMLTAKDQVKDILAAFSAGANDYITKPYDREVLKARVKNLLELKYAVKNAIQKTKDLKNEKQKRELAEMLANITTSISKTLDIDEVMKVFAKDLKTYFRLKKVCILLNDKEPEVYNSNEDINYIDLFTHYIAQKENKYIKEFLNNAMKSNFYQYIKLSIEENYQTTQNWTDFPIIYHDKILGFVSIQSEETPFIDQHSQDIITAVINQAGTAIENAKLYTQIKLLATIDGLTGLFIRRHFFETTEAEFNKSKASGKEIGIIMMDIDNFKKVNDNYGHASGDIVLKKVAEVVNKCAGKQDICGRYGGEEFIVASTNIDAIEALAENIRQSVANLSIKIDDQTVISPTISLGLSLSQKDESLLFEIIKRADEALYKAKKTGKNKVVCYEKEKNIDLSSIS